MATYEEEVDSIHVPNIVLEDSVEFFEVYEVAAAFLYDASGPTYTDYTAEANSAAAGDVPLLPNPIGAGDGFLVGSNAPFDFVTFEVGTAGVGTYGISFYYWNGAWTEIYLQGLLDRPEYIYQTLNNFKTTWLVRFVLHTKPDDWALQNVGGRNCYYLFFGYTSGTLTTQPVADQIWLGTWSVAYTADWSDTMAITDTNMLQLQTSKAFSDNMAIDDTQAGQWSVVWNIVRSWSDIMAISDVGGLVWNWLERNIYFNDTMTITDLTDTQGMQFQISVNFADIMTIADLLNIAGDYAISFMDIMQIIDETAETGLAWNVGITLSDIMSITDQGLTFNIGLNLSDLMEIIDQGWAGLDWARAFHDVMTITDSILWRGDYPAPVYLRFSARRPQITIYTKEAKKQ